MKMHDVIKSTCNIQYERTLFKKVVNSVKGGWKTVSTKDLYEWEERLFSRETFADVASSLVLPFDDALSVCNIATHGSFRPGSFETFGARLAAAFVYHKIIA